jgi:hypothetical protein
MAPHGIKGCLRLARCREHRVEVDHIEAAAGQAAEERGVIAVHGFDAAGVVGRTTRPQAFADHRIEWEARLHRHHMSPWPDHSRRNKGVLSETHGAIEDPVSRLQRANVDEGIPATGLQAQRAQMGYAVMEDQRARMIHQLQSTAAEHKQHCS